MRTLLILVDGMRPDSLTNLPEAQKVIKKGASTMNARTVMPSVTLPCHVSLFHSVDPARHGTTTNTYAPQVRPINGLCEVLKANKKSSAIFYSWEQLRDITRPSSLSFAYFKAGHTFNYEKVNSHLTDVAIDFLAENKIDFTFLYLALTDEVGHAHGWMSEEYMRAMRLSWIDIDRIVSTLPDDYTVIITADHGGHDRTHGYDCPEDMTIPMVILGKDVDPAMDLEGANIKDIAPTIVKLLGVEAEPEWEGKSLL